MIPPIPERVRLYPFHRPYGAMVVDPRPDDLERPVKSLETRGYPPPESPERGIWIAVYNAAKVAVLQPEARTMPAAAPYISPARDVETLDRIGPHGVVLGMVYVVGALPLRPADLPSSFFYAPHRWAWELRHPRRFARPIRLAALGVKKAPQSFCYVPGSVLQSALSI